MRAVGHSQVPRLPYLVTVPDAHTGVPRLVSPPPLPLPSRYVLKNVVRDWSAEGAAERAQSYGRITAELRRLFGGWPAGAPEPPAVLVPGVGLGRLCLEITNLVGQASRMAGAAGRSSLGLRQLSSSRAGRAADRCRPAALGAALQGYSAQGNEFSYFMILASAYLLNGVERELQARCAAGGSPCGAAACRLLTRRHCAAAAAPLLEHAMVAHPPPLPPAAVDDSPLGAQQLQQCELSGPAARRAGARRAPRRPGAGAGPAEHGVGRLCGGVLRALLCRCGAIVWGLLMSGCLKGATACSSALGLLAFDPALGPAASCPSPESFDAVASCFFLDTAHSVLQYLEVMWAVLRVRGGGACLRRPLQPPSGVPTPRSTHPHPAPPSSQPGGYVVNLGPLLYHWADAHTYLPGEEQQSLELSLDEVKAAAQQVWGGPGQSGAARGREAPAARGCSWRRRARQRPCPAAPPLQIGFVLVHDEMVPAAFLCNQRWGHAAAWRCLVRPPGGRPRVIQVDRIVFSKFPVLHPHTAGR